MIKQVVLACAAAASIIGLSFAPGLPMGAKILICFVGIACLIINIYFDVIRGRDNIMICHSNEEIETQMHKLIKIQGKICIMSRDLSWVNNKIEAAIIGKRDSMLIFAQHSTVLTKRLSSKGVPVFLYGESGFEPKTRFTIIRYNQTNPQIAIAKPSNNLKGKHTYNHKIYQAENVNGDTDAWLISLAMDLMELCKKTGIKEV